MDRRYFTDPDTWNGGYYGLAIEIGQRSDERLFAALDAVWSFPDLEGIYLSNEVEPNQQEKITSPIRSTGDGNRLYGLARLFQVLPAACGTLQVREEKYDNEAEDEEDAGGIDWLLFYIPIVALGTSYPIGGYPFDQDDHLAWRTRLDEWLASLGHHVFKTMQFDLALIGMNVSGYAYASQIKQMGVPTVRPIAYLVPEANELRYYPATPPTIPSISIKALIREQWQNFWRRN